MRQDGKVRTSVQRALRGGIVVFLSIFATVAGTPTKSEAIDFNRVFVPTNPASTGTNSFGYTGCAWIDYDDDGWEDLFVIERNGGHYLYKNNGDGTFTSISGDPIVSQNTPARGTSWADYDNDGDLDCFVSGEPSKLFTNNGDGSFTLVASGDIVTEDSRGWSSAWGDYDNDGDVDMVVSFPSGFVTGGNSPNQFYLNSGPPNYELIKVDTGDVVANLDAYTVGTWNDYDLDGDIDLFFGTGPASGSVDDDRMYHNNLKETGVAGLSEITTGLIATDPGDGQVWNFVDMDNDGDLDAYRTNWSNGNVSNRPNDLYRNNGDGTFTELDLNEITDEALTSLTNLWADFDNDGDLDCFVTNDANQLNSLFRNDGNLTFTKITGIDGTNRNFSAWGATAGDYDNDGDMDLFVSGPTRDFLENTTVNSNNWLKIKAVGDISNRSAIGTIVRAKATINGTPTWQIREISAQNAFMSHNSLIVHFGLGDATTVDSLEFRWPSGIVQYETNVSANQQITVTEFCAESDGDGIVDCLDNCPSTPNADQADADGDGIGDVCDPCVNDPGNDADGDGLCADADNCPDVSNAPQADADSDGVGDLCDNCPDIPNPAQADDDSDGIGNLCETCCVGATRGDVNGDGNEADPVDLSFLVNFLFGGGPAPLCDDEADVNGDGNVADPVDLSVMVDFLFGGGSPPDPCP